MIDLISSSKTRIQTGLSILVFVLFLAWINSFFIMWIFFGVLLLVSTQEAMRLYKFKDFNPYFYLVPFWIVAFFYPEPQELSFLAILIAASILAYKNSKDTKIFLILLYPLVPYLFLLSLYEIFGLRALLWLLVLVVCADAGAYFVGKSIGSTQFCKTSPNKTLEGLAGGLVIATIVGAFFSVHGLGVFASLFISFCVALGSVFGDLFESYLKRIAGVKDSGDILPGHGGILDRLDGYLFASIVMLVLLKAFV